MADWAGFSRKRKDFGPHPVEALRERLLRLQPADPFLSLDGRPYDHVDGRPYDEVDGQPYDKFDLVALCHHLCKGSSGVPPTAVFMGGTVERTHFALMRRPVAASDFVRMWTEEER